MAASPATLGSVATGAGWRSGLLLGLPDSTRGVRHLAKTWRSRSSNVIWHL